MPLVGISGPLATGKSTLVSMLEPSLPIDSIVIKDIHDVVYGEFLDIGEFKDFQEISKDRSYLFTYINRLIEYYVEMIEAYKDYPGIVLFDDTHIDILIYTMLNLWYYPHTAKFQESMVNKLLSVMESFAVIYMTTADDQNYPLDKLGMRRYCTSFLKNRQTELYYYDIFRHNRDVVTLPSTSVLSCDKFIIDDLKSRGLFI